MLGSFIQTVIPISWSLSVLGTDGNIRTIWYFGNISTVLLASLEFGKKGIEVLVVWSLSCSFDAF